MASLCFRGAGKAYSDKTAAVSGFDLEVKDKEFIVLAGPAGSGKSTVLKMIAGLEKLTEGELLIDGEPANETAVKDRDIVMMFQNYALDSRISVYENMASGLKLRKTPADIIDRRVKEAAEILGLTPLLSSKPKALSGAQRQRVAFGRAIVRRPKIFLLDEPLSHLDPKLRLQMRADIVKLYHKLNTTFIYTAADQAEAMTMGARIVVMKDGRIQQTGTPEQLYNEPANTFVAAYIGAPQMNMIPAALTGEGGNITADAGGISITLPASGNVSAFIGKKALLGVRPEDISLDGAFIRSSPGTAFTATVASAEELGNETLVYLKAGQGALFLARAAKQPSVKEGMEIKAAIDGRHINLFDFETGMRI